MRIVLTADPYLPVPPTGYGGIERVVALLADELVARGHHVTLIAHPASRTRATLVPYGVPPHSGRRVRVQELLQVGRALLSRRDVDLVHSFGRLAALAPILPLALPKLQSYQRAVPWGGVARASWLAGRSLAFTGCSNSLQAGAFSSGAGRWHTVFNPVDTARVAATAQVAADAPLMFLGRLEAIKGVHDAIAIAQAARRRLVIAGNRVPGHEGEAYFATVIAPAIDGHAVQYVGEVDDVEKARWLRQAAALLMPVHWEEPFGIVMAEALACGTPIIGYRRGSVPEVVRHGVTGFVCDDQAAAVAAVTRLDQLERRACRADAETRFGVAPIVDAYERIYAELRR